MKNTAVKALVVALLVSGICCAVESPAVTGEREEVDSGMDYRTGGDLGKQNVHSDRTPFLKGVYAYPQFNTSGIPAGFVDTKKEGMARYEAKQAVTRADPQSNKEKYIGEGRDFLIQNAKKEGVVSLPSGLQYKIIEEGRGRTPGPNDTVLVLYRGTLIDGTQFGGPAGKPKRFRVNAVIRGWREALQLMKEGSKWQLFIPSDLAFGERGPLADRTVIYDLELISIEPTQ